MVDPILPVDIFALPVHPAADKFPMMGEEELGELAQSIKANGLYEPLVVHPIDGVLTLIDGRNRREACRRAGFTPETTLLDGQDPVAYIIANNINRRHLNKGQQAMAVAMICLETKQTIRDAAKQSGLKTTVLPTPVSSYATPPTTLSLCSTA